MAKEVKVTLRQIPNSIENMESKRCLGHIKTLLKPYCKRFEEVEGGVDYYADGIDEAVDMLELIRTRVGGRTCNWHSSVHVYCYALTIIKEKYGGSRAK